MRFPARFVADNLIWTRDGTVWAVWRVTPTTYPYLSATQKLAHHDATRSALLALPAESMILSLCTRLDPYEVTNSIVGDVDLDAHPAWRAMAERDLALLSQVVPYTRMHFLAAELPTEGGSGRLRAAMASARAGMSESAGGTSAPVPVREVAARRRQAEHLLAQLERVIELRKATPGEIRWIYARAPRRGLEEPYLDDTWEPAVRVLQSGPEPRLSGPCLVGLGDGVFKEGGVATDADRPRHRRYLRVESEGGVSYQSFLCLSDMPHEFVFPDGAEWFFAAESAGFPVDWCARIRSVANRDAQLKARRQARQLAGQVEEYEGEPSGPPESLAEAMKAIGDLRARLSANPADPELQCSIIFATWAPDLIELEQRVALLRSTFVSNAYDMHRPTGGQLAMFGAMLPGTTLRPPVRDYVAYLLAEGLAAGAPFAGTRVGSSTGMLLGYSCDAGTFTPVLFNPAEGAAGEGSGSLGAFGVMGFGKSYLIKRIAHAVLSRGGMVCALDRTEMAEYTAFARVAPGRAQVVEVSEDANVCLDPLRVFPLDGDRLNHTLSFLTLLTGISNHDVAGLILEEAVGAVVRRSRQPSMNELLELLEEQSHSDPDNAGLVYRKLASFARNPLGRLVFGDAEMLTLDDADYICFHVPGLDLPPHEYLVNEHLYRRLLPRQILSQALLYLLAAVARTAAFASSRFGAVLLDEAWSLTASPQGRALILEGIRDGRKHNAAVWLISQHPSDLGDDALAHLLAHRFVFRQNHGAAAEALSFLGMEGSPRAERTLAELEPGRFLYRDVRDRVGCVQGLAASDPALNRAFDTNPHRRHRDAEEPLGVADGSVDALVGVAVGEPGR